MGKKILIILIVILIIFAAGITFINAVVSNFNKPKGNHEKILKSKDEDSKKALVIYQPSMSSFTKNMAYKIAEGLNKSNFQVTINNPGEYLSYDISKYSVVVFGTPVYGAHISEALENYIKSIKDFSDKDVIFFSTGGTDNEEELKKADSLIKGAKSLKKVKFKSSDKDKEQKAYKIGLTEK